MGPAFDAFARARAVAARVQAPGRRLVSRVAAGGACHDAPTLFLPGCNLACVHCWADPGREDPGHRESLLTHVAARRKIARYRRHNRLGAAVDWIRLSGGEPILDAGFFELLEALLALPGRIYVETNGTLLGAHPAWLDRLMGYGPRVRLNISLKAGTGAQFSRITGADPAAWEATFDCLSALAKAGVAFELNALTRAEALFSEPERQALLSRLGAIAPSLPKMLVEEKLTTYPQTRRRMAAWRSTSGPGWTGAGTSTSDPADSEA